MNDVYFTTKVATESTFCNRFNEKALISQNIKKNQHTVMLPQGDTAKPALRYML